MTSPGTTAAWMEPFFNDHREKRSPWGTWNFRGFSPLNIHENPLKVKKKKKKVILHFLSGDRMNETLIHCSLNSSKMFSLHKEWIQAKWKHCDEFNKFMFKLWLLVEERKKKNTKRAENSPFCSFMLGRWNLVTWLDSASEPYCWRSDARRKKNGRIIWMSGGGRSQGAVDGMVGLTTHMRRSQDTSAAWDTFGDDRSRVEST